MGRVVHVWAKARAAQSSSPTQLGRRRRVHRSGKQVLAAAEAKAKPSTP